MNESREYQIVHFTDAELEAAAEEAESVVESWGGYENALIRALDKLGIQRHPEVKESK